MATLKEYLDNPGGAGNTSVNNKIIKEDLIKRYEKLEKNISMESFKVNNNNYYIHFIIPSETERENTYDVVLHVYSKTGIGVTIKNWEFELFSNSPAFVYTFAYSYNMYDMIVPELKNRIPSMVYKTPPYTRNPHEVLSYEKSIFFAVYYLTSSTVRSNRAWLESHSKKWFKTAFLNNIRSFNKIRHEIDVENGRLKEEKKSKKEPDKKVDNRESTVTKKKGTHVIAKRKATKSTLPEGKSGVNKIKKR